MSIIIREGVREDLKSALTLIQELADYENAPHEVEVNLLQMEEWGFGSDKQFDFFVAEKQGEIIGLALYYYKYSTWKGKCLFLEDLIVTETERKNGCGKLLFNAVVKVAKREQVKRMEWQVLEWNTPAIDFYTHYKANLDPEWINGKLTFEQLQSL